MTDENSGWPFEGFNHFDYNLIMADPPWQFKTYSAKATRNASNHYETMPTSDICKLPVGHLAAKDCALLIWGTSPMLPDVLQVIDAWGFKFKGKGFCWAKLNKHAERDNKKLPRMISDLRNWFMSTGYSSRKNTEDCWLATTGRPVILNRNVRELIVSPIRDEHSRKPDEAFHRAERLYGGKKIELFSREKRKGWDNWGKESDKFNK